VRTGAAAAKESHMKTVIAITLSLSSVAARAEDLKDYEVAFVSSAASAGIMVEKCEGLEIPPDTLTLGTATGKVL
jgi:hypothetical protein